MTKKEAEKIARDIMQNYKLIPLSKVFKIEALDYLAEAILKAYQNGWNARVERVNAQEKIIDDLTLKLKEANKEE